MLLAGLIESAKVYLTLQLIIRCDCMYSEPGAIHRTCTVILPRVLLICASSSPYIIALRRSHTKSHRIVIYRIIQTLHLVPFGLLRSR